MTTELADGHINPNDIDVDDLSDLIYYQFYNGPMGNATRRLATIIKRHLCGEPILTFDEVMNEYLEREVGEDERHVAKASIWKALNKSVGSIDAHLDAFVAFAKAKKLYDCIKERVEQ